jgi:hypothetical protein
MHHHVTTTTLVVASSQPNHETLATHEVLAHQRMVFHPCICRLCEGIDVVTAVLIGYDNIGLLSGQPQ